MVQICLCDLSKPNLHRASEKFFAETPLNLIFSFIIWFACNLYFTTISSKLLSLPLLPSSSVSHFVYYYYYYNYFLKKSFFFFSFVSFIAMATKSKSQTTDKIINKFPGNYGSIRARYINKWTLGRSKTYFAIYQWYLCNFHELWKKVFAGNLFYSLYRITYILNLKNNLMILIDKIFFGL